MVVFLFSFLYTTEHHSLNLQNETNQTIFELEDINFTNVLLFDIKKIIIST